MSSDTKTLRKIRQKEYFIQQLSASLNRLAELDKQGIKALSGYDIEIAHQGNADEALLTAKRLLSNQVKYFQQKVTEFKTDSEQLGLF